MNKVLFSSQSPHWATPRSLYADLDKEFHFNDDPCPFRCELSRNVLYGDNTPGTPDGLDRDWGTRTYCNPPYGHKMGRWIAKAYAESQKGKLIVLLIPSRTDTQWWHDYCMKASEIRFIRGRLKFEGAKYNAPFPSAIIIFRGKSL